MLAGWRHVEAPSFPLEDASAITPIDLASSM